MRLFIYVSLHQYLAWLKCTRLSRSWKSESHYEYFPAYNGEFFQVSMFSR